MLWILIAAAVCAGDLLVKHYIDTHKEENCHEPVVGGHIIITRFHNPGAMLGWMKDKPKMLMTCTFTLRRCLRACGSTPAAPISRPSAATASTSNSAARSRR